MKSFQYEIVTPERVLSKGEAVSIRIDNKINSFGIMANHQQLISSVYPGTIIIDDGTKKTEVSNGPGVLTIENGIVTCLVETAEFPEEIAMDNVEKKIEQSKYKITHGANPIEMKLAEAGIQRALARLKIKNKSL